MIDTFCLRNFVLARILVRTRLVANQFCSLLLALFPVIFALIPSGSAIAQFAGGDGSAAQPWEIATAQQLNDMRGDLSAHYILGADIDLTEVTGVSGGDLWNGGAGWEPVGSTGAQFTGSLNGNGFKITGLFINRNQPNVGLFGWIGSGAQLTGLALEVVNITGSSRTGGLVGINQGSVQSSYVSGTVNGTFDVGGLVGGSFSASVVNSYATANVTASSSYGGGLVGFNNNSTITNSYAAGRVSNGADTNGGLVGNSSGTTTDSYWNNQTSTQTGSAGGSGLSSAQMRQQLSFGGFDFGSVWQIDELNSFPVLRANPQVPPPGRNIPDAPTLTTPGSGATGVEVQPVLEWADASAESQAATDSYELQVSANADFSGPVVDETALTARDFTVGTALTSGTTYYWRVRAVNAVGDSAWSHASFTVGLIPGSADDPFEIATIEQLNDIRSDLGAYYVLTADMDLTIATGSAEGSLWNDGAGWAPVGGSGTPFTGNFDGNGFKITGLYINRPSQTSVGLFGQTGSGATLTGIALEAVNITGDNRTAGLVGVHQGTVERSYVTGSVTGTVDVGGLVGGSFTGSVANSYSTASVTATSSDGGGLVGFNNGGTVTGSYATGSVNISTRTGGLIGVGANGESATNSYWNNELSGHNDSAGGTGLTSEQMRQQTSFAGFDFGSVWQIDELESFPVLQANPQVPPPGKSIPDAPTATSPANGATGAVLLPNLSWAAASPESEAVTASYQLQVSVNPDFASPAVDETGLSTTQYQLTSSLQTSTAYYWRVRAVNASGESGWREASFTTVAFPAGAGTEGEPWQITTARQLDQMRHNLDAHYILNADIDLSVATGGASGDFWNDGKGWQPVGDNSNRFTGSLDGNGFAITGLHIDRPDEDYVGLFGYVAGASVTAVAIEGGSVSGGSNVGALAGILAQDSVLTDSHAKANVSGTGSRIGGLVGNNSWGTITNSHAIGNVDGGDTYIGGLAGSNDWEIFDSYATGNVTGITRVGGLVGESSYIVTRSYATGDVIATGDFVGGLVGDNLWKVDDSYATGRVVGAENVGGLTGRNSGGEVNISYASGSVTGDSNVGGLVGVNENSDVINSYWNTETTGQSSSAGSDSGYGLTSAQMRQQASFTGFDFDTVWQIDESASYPVLRNNTQTPPPGEFVAPTPPAGPPPGIISSENQGGVFFGEVTINPGGVLNGGQVTGTVQNNGEITGDVILGANTIINGGTVSGNISGNGNQPATINGARITSGASLNNVVIGNNAELDPDVQLGPNVRFTSPSSIPPGIDLTNALPSHNWAGGDGRSVPDLAGDVIILTDGVPPDSTIDAIRVPAGFEQGQSRQDSDTGELTIISGNVRATMLPGRVRQASTDQEEGIFISEDGDIVLVTANGREITSQPVVANRDQFSNVLGELGLESQFGDNASLRLTNPDSGTDNPGFLSVRPEVLSFPATIAQEEGLAFRPVPGINGATVAVMVYRDEDGNLMQQDLVPVPSDWQSLKSNLASIEGLSDARIDTQGIISVSVDGQPVRGQMQYDVTQGGFDDDVPAVGSVLLPAGDVNGDGTDDFRVVYADGSSQLLLIFGNTP